MHRIHRGMSWELVLECSQVDYKKSGIEIKNALSIFEFGGPLGNVVWKEGFQEDKQRASGDWTILAGAGAFVLTWATGAPVAPYNWGTYFQLALRYWLPVPSELFLFPRTGPLCLFFFTGPSWLPLSAAHQYRADLELSCVIISLSAASPTLACN